MRYIKLFENFNESISEEMIQDLKDICLELRDEGFRIQIFNTESSIQIYIDRPINIKCIKFRLDEIKEYILRIIDYLKEYDICPYSLEDNYNNITNAESILSFINFNFHANYFIDIFTIHFTTAGCL